MKKRFTIMIAAIIMLLTMLTLPGKVVADNTGQLTFSSTTSPVNDSQSRSWTISSVGDGALTYQNSGSCLKIGTNKEAATSITVTTSGYSSDNISKIQVWGTSKANTNVSAKVYIGSNLIGTSSVYTSQTSESGGTEYSVNNTNNYKGNVRVEISRPSSAKGAIYLNKVIVTYTTGGGGGGTTYTVTYNANDGTQNPNTYDHTGQPAGSYTVLFNTNENLGFTYTGHTFSEWNTVANGTGNNYDPADLENNTINLSASITLYAQWTKNRHNITSMPAEDDFGTYGADQTQNIEYGETVTLTYTPKAGFTEDYYAFWKVNGTDIASNTFTMPDENVTITVEVVHAKVDVITKSFIGGTTNSYASWSNKTGTSGAIYAGLTYLPTNSNYVQFTNSTSGNSAYAGIISTGTGGKVRKVVVNWGTTSGRTLNIYGQTNTAYTATSQLYNSSTYGTQIGTIVEGTSNVLTISGSGNYKYIGIISAASAVYLPSITIYWEPSNDPSITADDVNIECDDTNGNIEYTINNTPNPAGTLTAAIAQSPTSTIEGLTIGAINGSTVAFTCAANNTTTARTATVTLTYTYGNSQTATKDVVITQAAHQTPSITASDVNIAGDATNGSIAYTISNPVSGGTLTASTVETWLTPGEVTNDAVPFTCTANQGAAREATVVLTYTYNTNQTVTKNVTVTQATAPYTTIPALFAAATSSNKTVDVEFNNWVVSGVSTNGKNVFVTDNQGNGFVIYSSSDQSSTYAEGKILSGTASSCTLKLNNGYAQLTNVSDLTINTGGTVSVANIAMEDLSGVHTGALVSYTNLTSSIDDSGQTTKYYLSDGNTTIQIYGSLYAFGSISASKTYDITGIYQQYSNTKEVLPRSAADIVLKAQMTAPTFNAFTYVVGGTSNAQTAAIAGTDFTGDLTVTVAEGEYVISNDGSNYGTSATFTQSSGTISSQTLYVKLNPNLSEGTYNGRLSFTANYLDAFDVDLAGSVTANPTYNVTLTQPAGDIATIASDPTYAQSGATITLSYSDVDACYVFDHWTVTPDVTWVTTNSFTMPGSDVEVSATFNIKHFTVNYSVNGIVYDDLVDDNIECGDDAELWTEEEMAIVGVEPPTGYTLAGWSTSASSSEIVSSFTPSEDATLYAVLVPAGATGGYQLITSASDITAGTYLIGAFKSSSAPSPLAYYIVNGTIGSDGMEVTNSSQQTTDGAFSSLPTGGAEISLTGNNTDGFIVSYGSNSLGYTSYANKTIAWGDYDSYLWKFSDKENGLSTGAVYMTCHYNDKDYTVSENGTNSQPIRGYASSTAYRGFYLFKKVEVTPYTRVENITSTIATLPSIEPSYLITVKDGGILTLTGTNNGNASNLIIEDGGQLIINNDVAATVKKDIAKYDNATDKDGWYTIASPAAGANVSLAQLGTYDLFAYDEEQHRWLNVKDDDNNITTFAQGQGFLYANSANQTLPFAGTMKASNATVTVQLSYESADGKLKGFNLVGNPFTCNVTSGMVTMNGEALTTYYVAEGGSNLVTRNLANTPIKPGRGFFVQAPSGCDLVFNPGAKGEMDYKPTFISIEAGNGEFADRAYVQLGYGNTLRKMSINDNTPMVYVMNNDADYAAATVNALKGTMPVCFRAKETGHYTISVATEGLDMSYLHLIDRLTGADIDLLIEPSYSFIATKDDNQSRFILSFTADCFNEDEDEIFAYQNGNEIFVNGEGELQVFDVMGRMVATQRINGVETVNIPTQGVYIMRLNEKTQKIVVR